MGETVDVKVQPTNLKSQGDPIKWGPMSLCSFCISGLSPSVWRWIQDCCWSIGRIGCRAEGIKDKLETSTLVSITIPNHNDLQRIVASASLLLSKSCAHSLFGQLETRPYRERNSGKCVSSLAELTQYEPLQIIYKTELYYKCNFRI